MWRNWIARWTSNPTVAGSNPVSVGAYYYYHMNVSCVYVYMSLWRNWITRRPPKVKIAGSNPARDAHIIILAYDYQSVVPL